MREVGALDINIKSEGWQPHVIRLEGESTLVVDRLGEGPAVILIHGWSCRRSDWTAIAENLAQDFAVVTVDLPGHGDATTDRSWTIAELGDLVVGLVIQLGYQRVFLVGHSMGGAVAVEAAIQLQATCAGVIGVDSLTYMGLYPRQEDASFMPGIDVIAKDFDGAMVGLVSSLAGPGTPDELNRSIAEEMGAANPATAVPLLVDLYRWDMDGALDRLRSPLAIVAAQAHLQPEARARFAKRADLRVVDLGGHFFLREAPQETAELLRDILEESN